MIVDTAQWRYFTIAGPGGIFSIESCKCSNAGKFLKDGNDIEYIGAKKKDNGVMRRVKYNERFVTKGNCIIFICDGQGSVGYVNYIGHDFIGSTTLVAGYNEKLNEKNALFLVAVLDMERYRYSFGRKYSSNLTKAKIKLPATVDGEPDWEYMEKYIESLGYSSISSSNSSCHKMDLQTHTWKEFYLHRIMNVEMGSKIDAVSTTDNNPKYNYVSRNSKGNGVVGFVDAIEGKEPFPAGAMSLALGGSFLGACFVQPKPFYTAQNVAVLQEKVPLSVHTKLFIATLIRNECKVKYRAFARELNAHYKKDFVLKLPVKLDANGSILFDSEYEFSDEGYIPDWEWMNDYMKSLPNSDKITDPLC